MNYCRKCEVGFSGGNVCPHCGFDVTEDFDIGYYSDDKVFLTGYFLTTQYNGTRTAHKVYIPEGVHIINIEAFKDDYYLTEVYMPEGVEQIGRQDVSSGVTPFVGCESLRRVHIPSTVKYIANRAFSGAHGNGTFNIFIKDFKKWIEIPRNTNLTCMPTRLYIVKDDGEK